MSRPKISDFKLTKSQRNALDKQRDEWRKTSFDKSLRLFMIKCGIIGEIIGLTIVSLSLSDIWSLEYAGYVILLIICFFILGALVFGIFVPGFWIWKEVEEKYLDKLERKEIRKLIKERRQIICKLETENKSIDKEIARLEDLRRSRLDGGKIRSINRLLYLLEDITDNNQQLKNISDIINDKMVIVREMSRIENNIRRLSKKYKKIGDEEKANYYLKYINNTEVK